MALGTHEHLCNGFCGIEAGCVEVSVTNVVVWTMCVQAKWRKHNITDKLLYWMNVQKYGSERIYRLGSLPPFLLVFSGDLKSVEREWNLHDLGLVL